MKEIFTRDDTEITYEYSDIKRESVRRTVIEILKEFGLLADDESD